VGKLIGGGLPAALQALTGARSSGILTVSSEGRTACFALHKGQFLYASSGSAQRLGDAMLKKGLVTAETLESVLLHQRRKKKRQPLGMVLLELGLVTREVASAELEEQIFSVLREVLEWDQGHYDFESLPDGFEGVLMPGCSLETQLIRIAVGKSANTVS